MTKDDRPIQAATDEPAGGAIAFSNAEFLEEMYLRWSHDPQTVPADWRAYFENTAREPSRAARKGPDFEPRSIFNPAPSGRAEPTLRIPPPARAPAHCAKHMRVMRLIEAYRERGHLGARLDPLGTDVTPLYDEPALEEFGLSAADLGTKFLAGSLATSEHLTLAEIREKLRRTYCGSIGVEYTHIVDPEQREWLRQRMESSENRQELSPEELRAVAYDLIRAEVFEQFLHRKFVGTKRFSLEGAESLIPALDRMIENAAASGVDTILFGMAHRGRINVLAHIVRKSYEMIFSEFEDVPNPELSHGSGDVKYHLGFGSRFVTRNGKEVFVSLTSNPSHLEAENPVVEGRTRALQDRKGPEGVAQVLPVLIHGDAAFAGQGVIAETLNLGDLRGYRTGGTVHIIINNLLGFTTSPQDARSTPYATDVAQMVHVPIFHVNGHDVPALLYVMNLAFEFRTRFHRDAVVDLICYRKYGHNETDEPSFTQPLMYKRIQAHPGVRRLFTQPLIESGHLESREVDRWLAQVNAKLQAAYEREHKGEVEWNNASLSSGEWAGIREETENDIERPVETGVDRKLLGQITERMVALPPGFHVHPKIGRLFEERRRMGMGERPLDWATAEALAFGSLVWQGTPVRLSGQDSRRGTFSQRHAVVLDTETGEEIVPLNRLRDGQARFRAFDSSLSEAAILGFEYGYSQDAPRTLVLWEAQFGDFANGAQVIIDQFIVSAETKWKRMSGLVLLLPHGFEGQGPEHSSARPERFLSLCAQNNIEVCNPTTPAQYFHLLRRGVLRPFRKPLILFTPKSLLRHRRAVSDFASLEKEHFLEVLPDPASPRPDRVNGALLCSGKIYYELEEEREKSGRSDVALLRLEQIYPFPKNRLREALGVFRPGVPLRWVQEEPQNMGAWPYVKTAFEEALGRAFALTYVGRPEAASPASGYVRKHREEQARILETAFRAPGEIRAHP